MSVNVYYLSVKKDVPCNSYWDYTIIIDAFNTLKYETSEVRTIPKQEKAIVVIPARHHADAVAEINKELSKLDKVVLFLMGDEERVFPVDKIQHDNIDIWVQNPHPDKDDSYNRIGTGYAPHDLSGLDYKKDTELFFSGQITHSRRQEMKQYVDIQKRDNWDVNYTESFTAGLEPKQYFEKMARAGYVPCPSGAVIPDSFRAFEAFECMAMPILDEINPSGTINGYWDWLFDDSVPAIKIKDWISVGGYIKDTLPEWNKLVNIQTAWWIKWKRDFALKIKEQIGDTDFGDTTAIVCTSPIPSHPDTRIIDETIASIRHHLPDAEIILQIDGVREEQKDRAEDYEEYTSRVLWKCLHQWKNVLPVVFQEHMHQSGMARETLDLVKTPTILYVEQDTPLVTDYEIPLKDLTKIIEDGDSNVIRFHFEAQIPKEHSHMMLGPEKRHPELMRTVQWSQRPHLASTAYYRRIIFEIFSSDSRSFIEDYMHGVVHNGYIKDGLGSWHQHKLHIYNPEGNIKRSYHTDGREGAAKYDNTQIF